MTVSGLSAVYNGSAQSVVVTTTPTGLANATTYNGLTAAPVNAGSYTVITSVINSNYVGSATKTLVISPEAAAVSLNGLADTYNGSAQPVTVTTSPAGLATTTTYNGSATAPVNIGSYFVLSRINNSNFTGSNAANLIISPATATVTLSGLTATYTGSAQTVGVTTSPAGLATITTYNGTATPPINPGSYAVVSTINNSNYSGTASGTLVISPATATVSLSGLATTYTGSGQTAGVTTSPVPVGHQHNVQRNRDAAHQRRKLAPWSAR